MTEKIAAIAAAFVKAQKEFSPALKSAVNPAFVRNGKGGRYADLAACVDAVIDALNNNGLALMQYTHECTDGVLVETTLIHESGQLLSCGKLHVPVTKQDAQAYGSALTYARRYSLMAACGIAPEDDDGNAAVKRPTADAPKVDEKKLSTLIDQMSASESSEQLQAAYLKALEVCNGNQEAQARVMTAKKERNERAKKELAKKENANV